MNADQRRLIKLARRLLAEAQVPTSDPITIVVVQGHAITVTTQAPPRAARPATIARLSPLQERILAALTDRPVSGKQLAHRIGAKANFYFYSELRDLVDMDQPLVRKVTAGYQLYTC